MAASRWAGPEIRDEEKILGDVGGTQEVEKTAFARVRGTEYSETQARADDLAVLAVREVLLDGRLKRNDFAPSFRMCRQFVVGPDYIGKI